MVYIFLLSSSCIFRLSQFLFVVLLCIIIQQWQKPMAFVIFLNRMFKVSLKVFSINDSERSLPQVPNETLGLSSVSQTLSSSFNRLRRGITNRKLENTLVNHNIKHQMKSMRNSCHPQVCAHI